MDKRLLTLILVLAAAPLLAQTGGGDLEKAVDKTVETRRRTQDKLDDWAAEKSDLMVRYRNSGANVRYLEERVAIETDKALALEERIGELERRLDESTRLRESLQDTLDALYIRLEEHVERDLPFLPRERSARLASLEKELARPDVSGAEKLRRLLEAMQVEASYGKTVEVVQDRIAVGGDTIFVDMLRLGRVSLFWRTPDGERAGEYDIARSRWVELPEKYHGNIQSAMDMAARIRPVEIVDLPVGRIAK